MRLSRCLLPLALCLILPQLAHAEVLPIVTCVEEGGSWEDGTWYYDYNFTLTNPGSSTVGSLMQLRIIDAPVNSQDLDFTLPVSAPSQWVTFNNGVIRGWVANEGMGSWIAPGESLSDFRLHSEVRIEGTHYWQVCSYDTNTETDFYPTGTFEVQQGDPGVPEPCSLLLLGLAAGPALAWRRGKRAKG